MSGKKHPQPQDRTPADLLGALADALNACERGGVKVRLRHGAVFTHFGDVLPPEGKHGWTARVFGVLPESPAVERGCGD